MTASAKADPGSCFQSPRCGKMVNAAPQEILPEGGLLSFASIMSGTAIDATTTLVREIGHETDQH